jgi:RNase P subunit RPR2
MAETNGEGDRSASFLANLAVKMSAAGAAGLARELSTAARQHASRQGSSIPKCLANTTCSHCGSVFVPGVTSTHRIAPISARRRRKLQATHGGGGGGAAKRSSGGGGRSRNDFHAPNNEMRVSCHLCNRVTRQPGSEPVKKRPRKERSQSSKAAAAAKKKAALGGDSRARATGSLFTSSSLSSGFVSLSDPSKRRRKSTGSGGKTQQRSGFQFTKPSQLDTFLSTIHQSGGNKRRSR